MGFVESFRQKVFDINEQSFAESALELFEFQYTSNPVYQSFCRHLGRSPANVNALEDIPFLPIAFFKTHEIKSGNWEPETVFLSSGTSSAVNRSKHLIRDLTFYHQVTRTIFERHHPLNSETHLLAMLPNYLEQGNSSLISMVDHLIGIAGKHSGFYLQNQDQLARLLADESLKKVLLGVSYALLDLAESGGLVANCTVMETGGMKGRRKEITREDLHSRLSKGFAVREVHSEYGMSELMSQAYASAAGRFNFPPWAKCLIRDINDPFSYRSRRMTGGLNIVDLANVDTCAFIETMDLGQLVENEHFLVLGRYDNSDIRGCNLLI